METTLLVIKRKKPRPVLKQINQDSVLLTFTFAVITYILFVLALFTATCSMAQTSNEYPYDNTTHKITFRDTLVTALDSITANDKIQEYLFTTYKDVKAVGKKTLCNASFEVHKKNLAGNISHSQQNLLGVLNYVLSMEVRKGYVIINRTNFQLIGAMKDNALNPTFGQKQKLPDKPLETAKVNKEEVMFKLNEEKSAIKRILNQ